MNIRNCVIILFVAIATVSCKIRISVPESGEVSTDSGAYQCAAGKVCNIDVLDLYFDETFRAIPAEGYKFSGWRKRDRGFCGGSKQPCRLFTSGFEGNPSLMNFLESSEVFYLQPTFTKISTERLASTLYVVNAAPRSLGFEILEVAVETGAVKAIHSFEPLGGDSLERVADIAFLGSELYALSEGGKLYKLNLNEGSESFVGITGEPIWLHLMSSGVKLYGTSKADTFYEIDPVTGFSSFVHETADEFTSYLAIDFDSSGALYALTSDYVTHDRDNQGFEYVLITPNVNSGSVGAAIYGGDRLDDLYKFVDMTLTKVGLVALSKSGALYNVDRTTGVLSKYAVIQYENLGSITGMSAR